ncbi:MAG: hypothetical protein MZW92_65970 [Comamonadaceae bacterium]|nr:hypothetical protein [Comamonadaceae bacterium]
MWAYARSAFEPDAGRGLRLLRRARRRSTRARSSRRRAPGVPTMGRHAGDRRATAATTPCSIAGYPGAAPRPALAHAQAQVRRTRQGQRQRRGRRRPSQRIGLALRDRGRPATTLTDEQRLQMRQERTPAAVGRAACVAASSSARRVRRRQRHRRGHRLQPEPLGGADALPATTAMCRSTTTTSRTGSSPGRWAAQGWLFVGSQLAGQRAAVVMSLVQSAKLNGHDPLGLPHATCSTRLPTQLNSRLEELLPHRWTPAAD